MDVLAQIGGPLAAIGVVGLLLAKKRVARLVGLTLMVLGGVIASVAFSPYTGFASLAIVALIVLVIVAALFFLLQRWPWLLPLLALGCVPARLPFTLSDSNFTSFILLYLVITAATIVLALEIYRGDARSRELGPLTWPLAVFVVWSAVSIIWSVDIRRGATELDAALLPFTFLALALARLRWSRRLLQGLLLQFVSMAFVFAAIGIYQYTTRDIFWNPKVINSNAYAPFFRVNSVFWDPSIYGRFLVLAILACVALVVTRAESPWLGVSACMIGALWIGLALSFSQSSFTALVVGVLAAALVAWRRSAATPLLVVAMLIVPVGLLTPQARAKVLDGKKRDLSSITSARSTLVEHGIRIAVDHPVIGVGIGGFRRAYADLTGMSGKNLRKAASHTTPVTVAAEEGIVGLGLFLWLLSTGLVVTFRRAGPTFSGRTQLICALALTAIAVHSLFYADFFEDPMTWGVLAIAVAAPLALTGEKSTISGGVAGSDGVDAPPYPPQRS